MATMRLIPSTYYLSNSNYILTNNISNMYSNTDSTTYGTFTHNRASTSNTYYAYLRGFNFDDVPEAAEVTGFTIKIKASATGHTTSTSSSYYMSLYNGTAAIGSTSASGRLSTTVTTFTFSEGSLTWETLKSYGSNFGIRIPLRRASSNTQDIISVYGAEIEVTYTLPNPRTITVSLSGEGTVSPTGTISTYDGEQIELVITPTDKSSEVSATYNGTNITSQLVSHGAGSTVSLTSTDVTTSDISSGSSYAQYAVGNSAESPSSSGASSNMYASSGSTGYGEYTFDFSSIPSNANIESIEVRCYGHRESATIDSTHISQCVIYQGNTAISEEVDFPDTSNSIITIEPTTMPTRAQLDNVTIRHYVGYYGGLVLGITFEIVYSVGTGLDHYTYTFTVSQDANIVITIGGGNKGFAKINGTWQEVTKVYKKINNAWVEQTDFTNLFPTGVNYKYVGQG